MLMEWIEPPHSYISMHTYFLLQKYFSLFKLWRDTPSPLAYNHVEREEPHNSLLTKYFSFHEWRRGTPGLLKVHWLKLLKREKNYLTTMLFLFKWWRDTPRPWKVHWLMLMGGRRIAPYLFPFDKVFFLFFSELLSHKSPFFNRCNINKEDCISESLITHQIDTR